MKKYFMKGTEDELCFGDVIELDFTRENEDTGKVTHHHMECKFLPEFVDMLLEEDIIEERIIDDEEDFDIDETFKTFIRRIDDLDKQVSDLHNKVATIIAHTVDSAKSAKKPNKK